MKLYLDTSVVVAILVAEAHSEALLDLIDASVPIVSRWVDTEFASALSLKLRSDQIDPEVYSTATNAWLRWQTTVVEVCDIPSADFVRAAALCARAKLQLRAADALHLAVVEREGSALATLDRNMARAARLLGVRVLPE